MDRHARIAELAYQRHQRDPSASAEENWSAAAAEYSATLASSDAAEIVAARETRHAAAKLKTSRLRKVAKPPASGTPASA